ncbi:MAG: hypothetical protein V4450_01840 [Bacteroidota bacterium]
MSEKKTSLLLAGNHAKPKKLVATVSLPQVFLDLLSQKFLS